METWTAARIRESKGREPLACLTAYDAGMARVLDEAGIPLLLVGDSVAMTMLGYDTTLPVTVEQMLHHCAAVARGAPHALVVADMPFLSYQVTPEEAIRNAGRFLKEAGAGAVKIEGGAFRAPVIRKLVENGVPVLGHIGLTPQSIRAMGGYRVRGRRPEEAEMLLADARALADAGVFAIVLECLPRALGAEVTAAVPVPTIGIGAGPDCDGQILVTHDMLGFTPRVPKFVKVYAQLGAEMRRAVESYRREVAEHTFPADAQSY